MSARLRITTRVTRTVASRGVRLLLALTFAFGVFIVPAAPPAGAATAITGAGSTWSQIAVDQWRADVASRGLSVNYQGVGSTSGRVFYYQDQVDFAVSEIPFQKEVRDSEGNVIYYDEVSRAAHRPYAYMPIVAGGTSFMYHLDINGKRVTSVNLSGDAVAKMFTGVIKFWDDPAVKATNPTLPLPHLAVRPVIRSDGSGTSAQFTAYMANKAPGVWNAFCSRVGINLNPCPATSLYPAFDGAVAQQYSDGVAGYVASSYANGAITYVEYGYAKQRGYPVANLQNNSGFFVQPVAAAVSLALKGATFNPDGTQNLAGVYNNPDRRAYAMSSYSYLIVPTNTAKPFNADKGATLGAFILYMVCAGQQKAEQLGYAPLPPNLVQNAFAAEQKIPGAPKPPAVTDCHNPTIDGTYDPPEPIALPPAAAGNGAAGANNTKTGTGPAAAAATTAAADPTASDTSATGAADAEGQLVSNLAGVTLPHEKPPVPLLFFIVAGIALALVVFGPPIYGLRLSRRPELPTQDDGATGEGRP
jgi:phosphate transport system substrate-binding protein